MRTIGFALVAVFVLGSLTGQAPAGDATPFITIDNTVTVNRYKFTAKGTWGGKGFDSPTNIRIYLYISNKWVQYSPSSDVDFVRKTWTSTTDKNLKAGTYKVRAQGKDNNLNDVISNEIQVTIPKVDGCPCPICPICPPCPPPEVACPENGPEASGVQPIRPEE